MAETPVSMPRYPGQPPAYPGAAGGSVAEEPTGAIETPATGARKFFRKAGWIFLAVFLLVFFTLTKLPEERVKGLIQGNLSAVLASRGITMTAGQTKISYLFGPSYTMRDVTLSLPPPEAPAHIDEIEVSPSVVSLLVGKLGAKISITNGSGSMQLVAAMRGSSVSTSFKVDRFDIGKIALLKILSDVSGSAIVSGKGEFSTSTEDLTATDASLELDLQKILINSQNIQGFNIPALSMSQGHVDVEIDHGKGQIKALQIGKPSSPTDDIKAAISGELMLGKTLQNSTCNLKANFSLSDSLRKSFVLLDAILAPGKQPDGSYAYQLQGPLLSPNPMPLGAH